MIPGCLRFGLRSGRCRVRNFATSDGYLHKTVIPTSHFQDSLPQLKIPKLEDTCSKYLRSVTPLVSEAELQHTTSVVNDFMTNDGPDLQEYLQSLKRENFYHAAWEDMYLSDRRPLPINYNPVLVWKQDPNPDKNSQLQRTASLLTAAGTFFRTFKDGHLKPHLFHLKPPPQFGGRVLSSICHGKSAGLAHTLWELIRWI